MEVEKVKDNLDGSANVTLCMTAEEQRILIEYAVVSLLKEYINKEEGNK